MEKKKKKGSFSLSVCNNYSFWAEPRKKQNTTKKSYSLYLSAILIYVDWKRSVNKKTVIYNWETEYTAVTLQMYSDKFYFKSANYRAYTRKKNQKLSSLFH